MSNQIDGIKKLNKEDLEKSRKIVLDSIAEEMQESAPERTTPLNKKNNRLVDGVFGRGAGLAAVKKDGAAQEKKYPDKAKMEEKKMAPLPESPEERKRKEDLRMSWRKEVESAMSAPRRPSQNEKIPATKPTPKLAPKPRIAPGKKEEIKKAEESEKKRREQVEAKKQEVRAAKEEIRRKEETKKAEESEKKRREQAEVKKQEVRAVAKKKKQERVAYLKNKLIGHRDRIIASFFKAGRRAFFLFALILLVFVFIYSVFAVLLLKFNVDNSLTRYIAGYAVVPAIITNGQVIDYYKYIDIKAGLKDKVGPDELNEASRLAIAQGMIINSLIKKYNLSADGDVFEKINKNIVFDGDINVVAVNRIMKIKKMIDSGEDFIRTATRYGDDLGPLTISEENKSNEDYYEKLLSLEVGGNSQVIVNKDGYYIFHVFGKTENKTDLTYVVVRPMLFDEFMSESVKNYKVWSLVD